MTQKNNVVSDMAWKKIWYRI